jgi:hypothetical protein
MKRRTKLLLVIVAGLLLIGGIFGATAALADNPSGTTPSGTTPAANLLQKIADNYKAITGQALDTTALQQALSQAQAQVQQDNLKAYLDKLVANGVITQDQEDQYLAWFSARPDVPPLNGPAGRFGRFFGGRLFGHLFGRFGHGDQQGQVQPPATQSNFKF